MFCNSCGAHMVQGAGFCGRCGAAVVPQPTAATAPAPAASGVPAPAAGAVQAPPTTGLAVISLVFGILAWFMLPCIGSLVAVITGHMARGEVRRSDGKVGGAGIALTGLILGYASVALMCVAVTLIGVATAASPNLRKLFDEPATTSTEPDFGDLAEPEPPADEAPPDEPGVDDPALDGLGQDRALDEPVASPPEPPPPPPPPPAPPKKKAGGASKPGRHP